MIENQNQDSKLTDRIAANPAPRSCGPLSVWSLSSRSGCTRQAVGGLLSAVLGVLGQAEVAASIKAFGDQIPTLLSRDVIGNSGHYNGTTWEGNFLGLEPGIAWFIRVALVYAYSAVFIGWLINGYFRYREHYREADWTPGDDIVNRFRRHSWGSSASSSLRYSS